ncbi:MAG TPA: alpha/beta fold hydrolase [Nevskiaceae bacterium]|nr:alpha/beta fold hydrolase [Nevskiaceae bacterium]
MNIKQATIVVMLVALAGCASQPLEKQQKPLVDLAGKAGATHLKAKRLDDGGLLLNGQLDGNDFSVAIPWQWNRQAVVFANGYRSPGLPTEIPGNPLENDTLGFYRDAYAQGFATGLSAYAKAGMAVEHGATATLRLKQFVQAVGAQRTYLMGGSMGGNITVALLEQHPDDFAGAISFCGAVGGWRRLIGWAIDVRATYNYFTRGTGYELPGEPSIAQSALWLPQTSWPKEISLPILMWQFRRINKPVQALFDAAKANPAGPERRIIDNIVAVTGAANDPAGLLMPLLLVTTGQDDFNTTFGGSIYDNTDKVYSSPLLSADENRALNAGIERIKSDPAAVAYAEKWHEPTGELRTKLLTIYNQVDPLVPQAINEKPLREAVAHAGHADLLAQREVPSKHAPMPMSKLEGLTHCGFEPEQIAAAWADLRAWVENGRKPQ